ncbi:MAG: hypothetical protein LBB36_05775 [Fibromonadaceae bacterium]|jgi:hypothetical protein|nr:hypothetical protein [Fibromonadaceae bacterium]
MEKTWTVVSINDGVETVIAELPTDTEAYSLARKIEACGLKDGTTIICKQKPSQSESSEKKCFSTAKTQKEQRFPDSDTTLAEALQEAREGAKENLRVAADLAGNIDGVLELKKEHTKTKAYIKILEEAYAQQLKDMPRQSQKGTAVPFEEDRIDGSGGKNIFIKDPDTGVPSAFYWVKCSNRDVRGLWNKYKLKICGGFVFLFFPFFGVDNWAEWVTSGWYFLTLLMFAIIVGLYFGLLKWLDWLANDKKRQRKEYEKEKRFVAMVRANGMFVPFPGHKRDYRIALNFVESYERAYPAEYEPHRLWLTPEEFSYHANNALNKGRKPMI